MYLQRLEIHGFKSFAQKTILEFLRPKNQKKGLTAVVGPNGSGKSNIADAVRWVLGEQSLKLLRGKKSEDVIFAGSDKKARLGLAQVSLTLNNEDQEVPLDMSEMVIARRLYRDGESEYLVNGHPVRLHDIALLLARARFGQKTYSVIGQGMIDSILSASSAERKEFFDEAAGIKEFQIKRQQALSRLQSTRENLGQAQGLLKEIEPRLRSLNRQVKRLAEREAVEKELREIQKRYYGGLWHDLAGRLAEFQKQYHRFDEEFQRKKAEHEGILKNLNLLEKEISTSQNFLNLQKKYEEILVKRSQKQEKKMKLQSQIEILKVRSVSPRTPVSLSMTEVIRELESLSAEQKILLEAITRVKNLEDWPAVKEKAEVLQKKTEEMLARLKNPSLNKGETVTPELKKGLEVVENDLQDLAKELAEINVQMRDLSQEESRKKGQFFELQRQLQAKQDEVHAREQKLNGIQIELAKLETRRETLTEEINLEMGPLASEIKMKPVSLAGSALSDLQPCLPDRQAQIFKLKHQLELIGGIDPEAMAEHKETKERYDFLSSQISDLEKALEDTTSAIAELDKIMKERRDESLKTINEEFGRFFKILFSGGQAKLVPLYLEEEEEGDIEEIKEIKEIKDIELKSKEPVLAGIDIQATPPGKRIKDINVLSGGERALTSVALICAILSHSPSPFVILDEVDAALDEANSVRFAEIIDRLSEKTQIIIITHNRATMAKAQVLYGVTMGEDGVSRLLSVKLEEAEKLVE